MPYLPGSTANGADTHTRFQECTNLSAVVVLAENAPVTSLQKPAQLELLFHAQLKGKLPALFIFVVVLVLESDLSLKIRQI